MSRDTQKLLPRPRGGLRWLLNFVNLSTPLGVGIALLGGARPRPGPQGLLLAEGYRLCFPIAGAFTVGNVVITAGGLDRLLADDGRMLRHEARHAWQYAVCGGLPFLPLYAVAAAWSVVSTGDVASQNPFERLAGLADGGYPRRPSRFAMNRGALR
ncbi:hypothetical protein B0O41_0888 [Propionibacteriaceae bacterium ES.041]|uniref:hypothetical protein n=1 Tax=Enemella evansiae TaxID=2016499 RepID=UPI000C0173C4|nr:hypothetical protein [Enemella evansiae]PFG66109.1 hypothetical protein B0O41_0888 [Propionibacteriaceae bacterium ES.041]